MTAIGDRWRDIRRFAGDLAAGSFGTPAARRLRAQGRRMLRGEPEKIDVARDQVYADWAARRIDDVEAIDRLAEAGERASVAERMVSGWRRP